MSNPFIFKDSCSCEDHNGRRDLPGLFCAIEKLNEATREGKVQLLSISGKRRLYDPDHIQNIISYEVTARSYNNSWSTISGALFHVSRYIGSYSTRILGERDANDSIITIEIKPRWGERILNYLLQYTTGIYMPPDSIQGIQTERHSAEWILVLLWRSVFNQTLRRFHIPKEYRAKQTNDRFFRGRLDAHRQIRENVADQSKFCCVYSPLTIDTTINRTIRCVFRLLTRNGSFALLLNDMAVYDERLAAFGVKACDVRPEEIDRIRYTRMSEGYRPLMRVGKAIIRRFGASTSTASPGDASFFIDISEIWENYLQAILTRNLPSNYRVINPNETGGQWLVSGQNRMIRPDIIIENENGFPVAILDAKFKAYTALGKTANAGVSRDDLYQMTTYLYHYGSQNVPLLGLFISPAKGTEDWHPLENRRNHAIGVMNFDLAQWDVDSFEVNDIKKYEKEFVYRLQGMLEDFRQQCSNLGSGITRHG